VLRLSRAGEGIGVTGVRALVSPAFSRRASGCAFFVIAALLFAVSAAVTIVGSTSMSAMSGMPMPGGWSMSMMWMRMPGQGWPTAAASFLGMWSVMMVAMMLPSLLPTLWRHVQAQRTACSAAPGGLVVLVGVGYFIVWSAVGVIVFPLGVALAAATMQQPALARAVPLVTGVIVLISGALQFSAWKSQRLACCRCAPGSGRSLSIDARGALRLGLRLGLQCSICCGNLTMVLLVMGVMDLYWMTGVTAAITAERLALAGGRVARGIGVVVVGAGAYLLARALVAG
jgi:predicted metal-binding membrane protein